MSNYSEAVELELSEHIRKAISPNQNAPKQKHIRWCILYAWERNSCADIWTSLKMQSSIAEEVGAFKALIFIHKMLMGGPPSVLVESYWEKSFFDSCFRYFGSGGCGAVYGFGGLVKEYVQFLQSKLEFHHVFKEFTGNFDFEAYSALGGPSKGVQNVDEAYQILDELMDLQGRLEAFYKCIFRSFGSCSGSECGISSLVPVVEESWGIWNFLTSFLLHLLRNCKYLEPLLPLQEKYLAQFEALKRFYDECRRLPYLTSLIAIPTLPDMSPVSFKEVEKKAEIQHYSHAPPQPAPQPIVTTPSNEVLLVEYTRELQNYKLQWQKDQLMISEYSNRLLQMDSLVKSLNSQLTLSSAPSSEVESLQKALASLKAEYSTLLEKIAKLEASSEQTQGLKEQIMALTGERKKLNLEKEKILEQHSIEMASLNKQLIEAKLSSSSKSEENNDQSEALIASFNEQFAQREIAMKKIVIEAFILRVLQAGDDYDNAGLSGNVQSTLPVTHAYLECLIEGVVGATGDRGTDLTELSFEELLGALDQICTCLNISIFCIKGLELEKAISCEGLINGVISFFKGSGDSSVVLEEIESISHLLPLSDSTNSLHGEGGVQDEISNTSLIISDAISQLNSLKITINLSGVHSAILEASISLATIISHLIKCATVVQQEIVAHGKGTGSADAFYKKNHRWTQGLVSAAKAVGVCTEGFVGAADKIMRSSEGASMNELIVASQNVSSATAQLVASARVKAQRDSKAQWNLEEASSEVSISTRALIDIVKKSATNSDEQGSDFSGLSEQQMRVQEMNQQIKILALEQQLCEARRQLGVMRRQSYHE